MNSRRKTEFVRFLVQSEALRFGNFTTKSGRQTPYFVNTGMFRTGASLSLLGEYYAEAIAEHFGIAATNLFGPAYKGIPLCAAAAMTLQRLHGQDCTFTYNRKEAKDHGEGGMLVGDTYSTPTNIVIVEDVITAGTSVRETMQTLSSIANAHPIGLVVSVDRREKLASGRSALQEVESEYGIRTTAICTIDDILAYASSSDAGIPKETTAAIAAYRDQWGA